MVVKWIYRVPEIKAIHNQMDDFDDGLIVYQTKENIEPQGSSPESARQKTARCFSYLIHRPSKLNNPTLTRILPKIPKPYPELT